MLARLKLKNLRRTQLWIQCQLNCQQDLGFGRTTRGPEKANLEGLRFELHATRTKQARHYAIVVLQLSTLR